MGNRQRGTGDASISDTTATSTKIVKAMYDFHAEMDDELSFRKGEMLEIIDDTHVDWWKARSKSTKAEGYIPSNYVTRTVEALYDYYAQRDIDLSFRKGEMLEIIDDTHVDWWKASSKSTKAEGYIPSNYVTRGGKYYVKMRQNAMKETPPDHQSPKTSAVDSTESFKELEEVYSNVKLRKEVTSRQLRPEQIQLGEEQLWAGGNGSRWYMVGGWVWKGTCRLNIREIPVAIKVRRIEDLDPKDKSNLMNEVDAMKTLDHPHIVRLIGMCEGETLMVVMELAKLGPLLYFLRENKHLPLWNILELMWQVAQGMAYLEKDRIVHRDLAARNILLCDQHFIKISNFAFCKAAFGKDNCYKGTGALKFPVKWTSLEGMLEARYNSKSDVWSYGVTLWEAVSYGAEPYPGMKNVQVVEFVEAGNRMSKPTSCPDEVYEVMGKCWLESPDARPTFKQLVPIMEELYHSHQQAAM